MSKLYEQAFKKLFINEDGAIADDLKDKLAIDITDPETTPANPEDDLEQAVAGEGASELDNDFEKSKKENEIINQTLQKQDEEVRQLIFAWIERLEDIATFLNDPSDPDSMRTVLDKNADNETSPLSKIASAGRLSNISGQIKSFVEQLRGCVNQGIDSTLKM